MSNFKSFSLAFILCIFFIMSLCPCFFEFVTLFYLLICSYNSSFYFFSHLIFFCFYQTLYLSLSVYNFHFVSFSLWIYNTFFLCLQTITIPHFISLPFCVFLFFSNPKSFSLILFLCIFLILSFYLCLFEFVTHFLFTCNQLQLYHPLD